MTGITRATIAELKQHLIVFLNDLELGKIYTRRWWWGLEVHGFQGLGDSIGHDKVSIPFTIGGHNVPRRFFGARCRQDIFKCLHVISPAFTFLEVARVPFPLLFGVMDSLLQPFLLLVFSLLGSITDDDVAAFHRDGYVVKQVGALTPRTITDPKN